MGHMGVARARRAVRSQFLLLIQHYYSLQAQVADFLRSDAAPCKKHKQYKITPGSGTRTRDSENTLNREALATGLRGGAHTTQAWGRRADTHTCC